MRKNNTTIFLVLSFILMIIVVGAYLYFFRMIKHKIEHTFSVVNTLENKKIEKQNTDLLAKKIEEIEFTKNEINNYFINGNKIENFVEYLEKLGFENGTELLVSKVDLVKDNPNLVSISLAISGSFNNVMKVIGLIENAPYQIHIYQSNINKGILSEEDKLANKNANLWTANISFNILSF